MRKIISSLAVIIAIAAIVSAFGICAYADMGDPTFMEVEVVVTKPEGIEARSAKWSNETKEYPDTVTIAKDETLTVRGEYYDDDGVTLMLIAEYNGSSVYVKASDVDKITDTVDISHTFKTEKTYDLVAINKDGSPIRKGPSEKFEEVDVIPFGTEILCNRFMERNPGAEGPDSWGYITYGGKSGWIHLVQYGQWFDFADMVNEDSGYTGEMTVVSKGLKLRSLPDNLGMIGDPTIKEVSGEIPVGTELKFSWFYIGLKQTYAYTEYNGVKGWVLFEECNLDIGVVTYCYVGYKAEIISSDPDGLRLYSEPYNKGEFIGEYLSCTEPTVSDMVYAESDEYSEDHLIYCNYDAYRVTVNGKTGWVLSDENLMEKHDYYNLDYYGTGEYYCTDDVKLYSKPDTGSPVVAVCHFPDVMTIEFYSERGENTFRYASCNGTYGWISEDASITGKYDNKALAVADLEFYSDKDKDATAVIPEGTVFITKVNLTEEDSDEFLYYVEYNGENGFIKNDMFAYGRNEVDISDAELTINEKRDLSGEEIGVIPEGEYFELLYIYKDEDDKEYNYVRYDGKEGWAGEGSFTYVSDITEVIEEETTAAAEETAAAEPETHMSSKSVAACCIAAAAILCIGAGAATAFIIKKKSDGKKPEKSEENDKNMKDR